MRTAATAASGLVVAAALVLGSAAAPAWSADPDPAPAAPDPAPAAPAAAVSDFVPVGPQRWVDTRIGQGITGTLDPGRVAAARFAPDGPIPADAHAVVLNVTVTGAQGRGHVTVHPCGSPVPATSSLNFTAGATVANQVTVKSGAGPAGQICFWASAQAHLVVDVNGYHPAGSDFRAVAPSRLADTRPGQPTAVPKGLLQPGAILEVPTATAQQRAAALNITATGSTGPGHVTVFPCGSPAPRTSALNFATGQTIANAATVALGPAGSVCVTSSAPVHVIVDAMGYHSPASDLRPLGPVRITDTRPTKAEGWAKGQLAAGVAMQVPVVALFGVPNGAASAVLNVTITQPATEGWAVAYACGQARPAASHLNFTPGRTVANAVTAPIGGNGAVCVYSTSPTHLVVDLAGYYPGTRRAPAPDSTFVRAGAEGPVFAVAPAGNVLPVGAADLAALGNPPVQTYPLTPGTVVQRASWSTTYYATPLQGSPKKMGWPEFVARGTPAVSVVASVPGTSFLKTADSATVYAAEPDGGRPVIMSANDYAAAGRPTVRTVAAVPGSRVVRTDRSTAVYALAPDGTTGPSPLTAAQLAGLGNPRVEVLPWYGRQSGVGSADLWASYRAGCPVGPSGLTRFEFPYWDFAGRLRGGTLILARSNVGAVANAMRSAYDAHFPLQEVVPVEKYRGNDEASMAAGNTSAFNCRPVVGNPTRLSAHSYGVAIDINPAQNPYVTSSRVYPPGSQTYLDRSVRRPGMHFTGGPVVAPLQSAGWWWGARWSLPDYHHFSSTGG